MHIGKIAGWGMLCILWFSSSPLLAQATLMEQAQSAAIVGSMADKTIQNALPPVSLPVAPVAGAQQPPAKIIPPGVSGNRGNAAVPAAIKPKQEDASKDDDTDSMQQLKIDSLLFTPNEIKAIRAAISVYKNRVADMGGGEPNSEENTSPKSETPVVQIYTYPQFFVNSIVYHSPTDWVIWVNDMKITQDTAKTNKELTVEAIDKNTVTLQWHPSAIDKEKVMVLTKTLSIPPGINIDILQGTIQFTLHTNQTFSSYVMRVLEGKVIPVTLDLSKEVLVKSILEPNDDKNKTSPDTSPDTGEKSPGDKNEGGLGGLIDAYKDSHSKKQ